MQEDEPVRLIDESIDQVGLEAQIEDLDLHTYILMCMFAGVPPLMRALYVDVFLAGVVEVVEDWLRYVADDDDAHPEQGS